MSNIIQRKIVCNMAQGYPNKVNAIVDEIVENNSVFKLKSPIEQDKEKDSIAKSINSALSVLNEVGKELVLQELSVDPDEKFKGFIDSVGNVDISGLSQMTATIVKEKIIEAEKEGIDLRQGQPVFKDNTKAILVGGVLTVAVIDTMVNNFNNLSYEQKKDLFDNWDRLTSPQKSSVLKSQSEKLQEQANKETNIEKKKDLEQAAKQTDFHSSEIERLSSLTEKEAQIENENLASISSEFKLYYKQQKKDGKSEKDIAIGFEDYRAKIIGNIANEISNNPYISFEEHANARAIMNNDSKIVKLQKFLRDKDGLKFSGMSLPEARKLAEQNSSQLEIINDAYTFQHNPQILEYYKITPKEAQLISYEKCQEMLNLYNETSLKNMGYEDNKILNKTIFQEIEQIPNALAKANFSQEDILEAMKQYRDYINNYSEISEEVADSINQSTSDEIVLNIQDDFNSLKEEGQIDSNVHQILNILAQVNYGSNMQKILTNSEIREQFLAQFDKVIEQGINLDQDVNLDEELAQIFGQYFQDNSVEMDVSAIEEQKEQTTYEEYNEEMAKVGEEYSAATQNIQGSEQFEESKEEEAETKDAETIAQEIAKQEENLPAKQDNSFIGKIRRVFANMRDMKNKDNSKGFFARLGASIQTVFGSKKEEYYDEQDTDITSSSSQNKEQMQKENQQTNYLTQHFDINEKQAIQDLKKKQGTKDPQLSQEDQELENV